MGDDWRSWYRAMEERSTMVVEQIPLRDVRGWGMRDEGIALSRLAGAPYEIIGVRVRDPGREVTEWDQPMIAREGDGYIVLPYVAYTNNREVFLLATKAEPGNGKRKGSIAITAPLQSSQWNLEARHGGKRPPRAALYDEVVRRGIPWTTIPQDPGMLFAKMNKFVALPVGVADVDPITENERWFTREEIREAFADGAISEHLTQALTLALL